MDMQKAKDLDTLLELIRLQAREEGVSFEQFTRERCRVIQAPMGGFMLQIEWGIAKPAKPYVKHDISDRALTIQ
jgi:hypothetical protein